MTARTAQLSWLGVGVVSLLGCLLIVSQESTAADNELRSVQSIGLMWVMLILAIASLIAAITKSRHPQPAKQLASRD